MTNIDNNQSNGKQKNTNKEMFICARKGTLYVLSNYIAHLVYLLIDDSS